MEFDYALLTESIASLPGDLVVQLAEALAKITVD